MPLTHLQCDLLKLVTTLPILYFLLQFQKPINCRTSYIYYINLYVCRIEMQAKKEIYLRNGSYCEQITKLYVDCIWQGVGDISNLIEIHNNLIIGIYS